MLSVALLISLIGFSACQTAPNQDHDDDAPLLNTTWQLLTFELQPIHNSGITLKLTETDQTRRLQGYSGCNQYVGQFKLSDDQISLNAVGGTKRMCRDMVAERYYHQMLGTVNRYQINQQQLQLFHNKMLLMTFVAKPKPSAETP